MPDGPFALVVGTNRPHKNHSLLARVWRAMGQRAPLQLVAAGASDPRYRNLHQLAPGLPTIHLLGKVSASELEWLYREATLVVFPTRYEGYGLPVIEAAVRGAPVLCSDIPALREVAGRFACLADPDDDEQWEREILRLSNDPEARASMRSAGLASTERLSYARIAESVHAHLVRVAMSRV